jgi:NADP-dependent 3-hydroxy acid dehydrogenase YdfG
MGMERWAGRVALVTGASSGIGYATARALADADMKVAALARRTERLQTLVETGGEILPIGCDLRDDAQITDAFAHIRSQWGGVDVLVNNAGLGHNAPLVDGETEHWREMLEVNVLALCICTREAITDMRKRGDNGHVLHVSSMAAHRIPRGSGVYSATKYAVRSLTEGLRQELRALGSDIRITAISPGFVETEFAEKYHRSAAAARETYGRYRCLRDDDVAEAVVYALSQPEHVQIHDVLMRPTHQES